MKVCVIGSGPWPLEPGAMVTGPSIRVRQFVEPLQAARHDVAVVLLEDALRRDIPIHNAAATVALPPESILEPESLVNELDLNFTEVVFGVGSLMPVVAACRLASHLNVPCWVDYFGDPLAELHASQLRQGGTPDTMARDHIWKFVRESLLRGDSFSTVSGPQRHALLGQLGLLGRYGSDWQVCRRIHEIPCAVPQSWTESTPAPEYPEALRHAGLDEQSRFVLFGGSWNVWLDETAMAAALRKALADDEGLHFVSHGIPTGPAGEKIRQSLMKELEDYARAGRVLDLPPDTGISEDALLAHAGACLSLDRPIPEAELGSRNRLLAMVRWGARPVVSIEAGVEALLVAAGLAAGIEYSNPERAAREILLSCRRSPAQREEDRRAGLEWLRGFTFHRTLDPVIRWIAAGAPRWPHLSSEGLVDRWASFPAEPDKLFDTPVKRKSWFFV